MASLTTKPSEKLTELWPAVLLPSQAKAHAAELAALSAAEWGWMIDHARRHGLAALLYSSVQPLSIDPHALQKLRDIYRQATLLAMQRAGELCRLLDALASAGICPVVFKGAALAHTLYPSAACRPMGDIDLWVTHDEMPAAIAALEDLGYHFREKQHRPHALTQTTDGEVQMLPGQTGQGLVELHWGVFSGEWLAHTAQVDRTGIRSRLIEGRLLDRKVLLLSPEDALIQLAVHISINHQMSVNALRSLTDIALMAGQPMDWNVVRQRAVAWRVATAMGVTLRLVQRLFGQPASATPADALAPRGLQRRLVHSFVSPTSIVQGRYVAEDRRRFAYLLCMTDRPVDSLRLMTHTIWPSAGWLAARYGRSDWSTRLRHASRSLVGEI